MTGKKTDRPARIIVQGKLTGQIEQDGSEHQVYQYHVNIHSREKNTPYEYDREIHIFRSVSKPAAEKAPANSAPYSAKPDKPPTAIEPGPKRGVLSMPPARLITNHKQKIRGVFSNTFNPLRLSRRVGSAMAGLKAGLCRIKIPSPNRIINAIKQRLPVFIPGQARQPPSTATPSKAAVKDKQINTSGKRLLTLTGRKRLLRLCLPCILLSVVAILAYQLPGKQVAKEKIIYPIDQTSRSRTQQAAKDYRAVIEKTGNGVVITLQSPDHEEVLTKLPPGYDPVVEGNKIVHIVTPGNTLWFIAMRYIKNPYRYPELARLNNIKNPDLIYPGDKVVIQYLRKP